MVMSQGTKVGITDLKARLSEHLRAVKKGAQLVVVEHGRPVATVERYQDEDEELVVEHEAECELSAVRPPRRGSSPISTRDLDAALRAARKDRW